VVDVASECQTRGQRKIAFFYCFEIPRLTTVGGFFNGIFLVVLIKTMIRPGSLPYETMLGEPVFAGIRLSSNTIALYQSKRSFAGSLLCADLTQQTAIE